MAKSDLSTDTLVYQAIQRQFRNAVVEHIRGGLSQAFPDTWLQQLCKPFKEEEWKSICSGVALVQAGGNVERDYKDEFDYLSVNHFYNLFDCHFKLLLPASELPSDEYLPKFRQAFLGWLREIKAVRDPMSHPPEQDLSPHDAWRVVDSARRVLNKLHLEKPATRVQKVADQLLEFVYQPAPDEILSTLDDTLPPQEAIVVDFIGRRVQLSQLRRWFTDPSTRRWLLVGDGGKGKSAIAYEFATEVRASSPKGLAGVFWVSAKRRRFDEGTVVEIPEPDFHDLDSLLTAILAAYGWSEDAEKSTDAKKLTVLGLLEELRSLLVIDDLDSIHPDSEDEIHEFLTLDVPHTQSKTLITSRRQFIGMGKTCTVIAGMSREEADAFIDSRLTLMEMPSNALEGGVREQVIEVCEGSPLYMEDLLRLCKFLPPKKAIQTWKSKPGEEVRQYALVREIEMLSPRAREVLGVCSLLETSVSVLELQRVLGLSEEVVVEAVDELRKMYLVPAPEIVENVPRFSINRNLSALMRSALKGSPKELELKNAIRGVLGGGLGRAHTSEIAEFCRQARVLVEAARYDEAETALETGLDRHPNHPKLLGMLGWVYKKWSPRRTADARKVWQRASDLKTRERSTYMHWARLEQDDKAWVRAAEVAELGAERCGTHDREDWRLLWMAGYARSKHGQVLRESGNADQAHRELEAADYVLRRAIRIARSGAADPDDISRAYRSWVITARERGDQESICSRLIEWLEWRPDAALALDLAEQYVGRCPELKTLLRDHPMA